MAAEHNNTLMVLKFESNKVPVFKEDKDKDWIIYGTDRKWFNRYPDYLLECFNRSGKHNALVTGKANYIAGNGFEVERLGLSTVEISELNAFIKKANSYDETFDEIGYKIALDVEIFGGAYMNGVWNKAGTDFEAYHCDYSKLRLSKEGDGYWYSEDWSKREQSEKSVDEGGTGLKFIPLYDPKNKKGDFIIPYREYRPGLKYYPLPGYIGAISYTEIDFEISNYHLNNIKTGFHAGTIISFNNGRPTAEEKAEVEKKIKEKFTGTDRAGSLLITFGQNKDNEPTITRIAPGDIDKQFETLNKQTQEELFIGHRITSPMLFGVKTEGQLGGRDELIEAYELFKSTYAAPKQKGLNQWFNGILALKGIKGKIKLKELAPIKDRVSEDNRWSVMTPDEKREDAGLEKLDTPIEESPKVVVSSAVHHFGCDCEKQEFNDKKRDIDDLKFFMEKGVDKSEYVILSQREAKFMSSEECFRDELQNYEFGILDGDVKMLYRNIIDLLTKNPLMDSLELAKALKTDKSKVETAIQQLIEEGALKEGEKKSGDQKNPKWTPTNKAKSILDDQPAKVENLQILYSYEPRPGLKAIIPGTREFCKELYKANKLFSRQEIEKISTEVGYDVWTKRGGWWTQKGGNVVFPYCRHIWMQNVVKKK